MKRLVSLAILLLIQQEISSYFVWGQTCFGALKRGSDPSDPPFNDDGNKALDANNSVQAIITTYEFQDNQDCDCFSITSWETFVQPSSDRDGDYDITFQVWRPSPTNPDCYSLVGQNGLTSISLSSGESVQLTPTPQARSIIARPGDVLGYYTNSRRRVNEGIQLDRSSDYNQNKIWYLRLGGSLPTFAGTSNNLASIGTNGYLTSLTNAAPAIKISTSSTNCPPSLPPTAASFTCPPAVQSSSPQLLSSTITAERSSSAMSETRDVPGVIASNSIIAISRSNAKPLPLETTAITSTSMPSSLLLLATRAFRSSSSSFIESNSEASSSAASLAQENSVSISSFVSTVETNSVLTTSLLSSTLVPSPMSTVETNSVLTSPLVSSTLVSSPVSTVETNSVLTSPLVSSTLVSSPMSTVETNSVLISPLVSSTLVSSPVSTVETNSVLTSPLVSSNLVSSPVSTVETNSVLTTSLVSSTLVSSPVSTVETNSVLTTSLVSSTLVAPDSSLISSPQDSIMPLTISRDLSSSTQITSNNVLTMSAELASTVIQPSSTENNDVLPNSELFTSNKEFPSSTAASLSTLTQDATESSPSSQISASLTATVVVIVVLLIILGSLSVMIIFIFVGRKKLSKKVEFDNAALDLSNPNYESSSGTFFLKEQKSRRTDKVSKTSMEVNSSRIEDDTYESLDDKLGSYSSITEPLDYSLPVLRQLGINSNSSVNASGISTSIDKDGAQGSSLYHDVGPALGCTSKAPQVTGRRVIGDKEHFRKAPFLLSKKINDETNSAYEELETPQENSEDLCEDSLPNKRQMFKPEEPKQEEQALECMGNYVPTEEERGNYEVESIVQAGRIKDKKKEVFFVEESIYWEPATTTSGLYSQLAVRKYREIPRGQIRLKTTLGSGQFGEVFRATWSVGEKALELAVKTLKDGASEEDKVRFLQEAAIMGQFSHTNVIKMFGVVTVGEPVLICLEILENGDLREYLQSLNLIGSKYEDFIESQLRFLKFAKDIAAGMRYLSKKSFVHRDLAARNVLLNKFLTCKVADFGMTRDLMDDTYYKSNGGKIPVKWTAPEALLYKKYSTDSDVWSYGMVLFEIWSVGRKPFSTLTNTQTLQLIQQGFCQSPPPGCPRAIYQLMMDCWNPKHQSRPSFDSIAIKYLSQSEEKLLHWAQEDNSISPSVGVCGASLLESEDLYLDLQKKYMTNK